MNNPCASRIVCPGSDSPFSNTSSESPDPFLFIGVNYCFTGAQNYPGYPKVVFGTTGQEDANLAAVALCPVLPTGYFSPVPVGPPPVYPASGICLAGCPDDTKPEPIPKFTNVAQSCTACCDSGPCPTFTMDAGRIMGRNQDEADHWAKQFACRSAAQLALAQCPNANCITIDGVTFCKPGSLVPPYNPPPQIAIFYNSLQSCSATCLDGSISTFTVRPGVFAGRTQLQADTAANTYACRKAFLQRFCVTDLAGGCCVGSTPVFTISAFGGSGDVTWTPSGGSLPNGLMATASGRSLTITGTATIAGNYSFSFTATDTSGSSRTKSFTITVLGITNDFNLPSGSNGVPYTESLLAAGGIAPYVFSLVSGAIPTGLTLGSNGVISGTPSEPVTANFPFVASVIDATGRVCNKSLNIFVQGGCIIADASPLPAFNQGQPYSHQFTVSGGIGPYTWIKIAGALPSGMTLSSLGLLSGTSNDGSDAHFTIQVTDSAGPPLVCSAPFVLPCIPIPPPKKFRIKNYVAGTTFSTPSCVPLLPPQGEPVWDGTFPFFVSGNYAATITPTNFVLQVLVNGLNITNLTLNTGLCFGGPEWQFCLVIDSSTGAWGGKKIGSTGSDSPVGIYTRFGGGCATGPATIEIEEY